MVEAVATLPVFIILFISIFHLRDCLVTTQDLDTKARSCAWLYSRNACTEEPPGCDDIVKSGKLELEKSDVQTHVEDLYANLKDGGDAMQIAGKLIGPAMSDLFSKAALADTERAVDRPILFGGDTVRIKGHYQLACDLKAMEPLDVAKDAWKKAWKKEKKK